MKKMRILSIILAVVMMLGVLCSCDKDKDSTSADITSSKGEVVSTVSGDEATSSESTTSVDTRYRTTREKKSADFKYKNVRIACIGDSITQGSGTYSGYRYYLYRDLISNGATFTYVGSERSADPRLPSDYQAHGGYGGAFIGPNTDGKNRSTYDHLGNYLGSGADIALVMIGHNNYFHRIDVDNISEVYSNFVRRICELSPGITVYCATIVNSAQGTAPDTEKGYDENGINKLLPSIVAGLCQEGLDVRFVDLRAKTNLSGEAGDFDSGDNTHPNEQGQEKMASVWCDAILDQVLEINDKGDSSAAKVIRPSSIKLSDDKASVFTGNKVRLSATVKPSDAKCTGVIWESSDESVATVDTFGLVSGVKSGTATITAKTIDGGIAATCEVTVSKDENAPKYKTLVSEQFTREAWEGDEAAGFSGGGWYRYFPGGSAKTVTTKTAYDAGSNFMVNMAYAAEQNVGISTTNPAYYVSFAYGDYELRVHNCGGTVKLFKNGIEVASKTTEYKLKRHLYGIAYKDGKITVHCDYETLFSVKGSMPTSSKITVTSSEPSRISHIQAIIIRKANS